MTHSTAEIILTSDNARFNLSVRFQLLFCFSDLLHRILPIVRHVNCENFNWIPLNRFAVNAWNSKNFHQPASLSENKVRQSSYVVGTSRCLACRTDRFYRARDSASKCNKVTENVSIIEFVNDSQLISQLIWRRHKLLTSRAHQWSAYPF